MEIKDIKKLIEPRLKPGQEFSSAKYKRLLSSGENYGSALLEVEIEIVNENNEKEVTTYVAKTTPPMGLTWFIFETKVTFRIEIAFYNTIVPTLNEFAREKGVKNLFDFLPELIAARISANPQLDEVDEDAVILLEDLRRDGYEVGNRFIGFDKESAVLLLNDLATMHAAVIAYKTAKPKEFQERILTHLTRRFKLPITENHVVEIANFAGRGIASNPKCVPHLSKIEEGVRNVTSPSYRENAKTDELYTTILHQDYWVNNTLIKYENGKPVKNKMVDFQTCDYDSLAHDLLYFLYTSVELSVLENHLDELYEVYYGRFIEVLRKLDCDVSAYSFDGMMDECGVKAKDLQFGHIVFLLIPILTLKGKAMDLNQVQEHTIVPEDGALHENYYKRVEFMLLDFVERKWL